MLYKYDKRTRDFFGCCYLFLVSFSIFWERFYENNYSTRACWISGEYRQLCAIRPVGYLQSHIQLAE